MADDVQPSPRLTELAAKVKAKQRGAEDAFWKQIASEGAPLVEDVHLAGQRLVTFVWHGKADSGPIILFGPVDGADVTMRQLARIPGTNVFARSLVLPDTARFRYGFVPNYVFSADPNVKEPESHDDPLNPRRGRQDSWFELPNAPPQPGIVPHHETKPGVVWQHDVTSDALGNKRTISVYTPPGYSTTGAPYPLVVAFDESSTLAAMAMPIALDELIAAHKIPPVVVVMIGNVDRRAELGASTAFADFVALDLVPWMREHYHATTDPRLTVVSGISLGGLESAVTALHHPEVFGNVLSQSGSYWWPQPTNSEEPESTARAYIASPHLPIRFWMEIGTLEFGGIHIAANRHLRDILRLKGYDVAYREFAGIHNYISWRGTFGDGLVALLGTPPKSPAPKSTPAKPRRLEVSAPRRSIQPYLERIALLDGGDAAVTAGKRLLDANPDGYALDETAINDAAYAIAGIDHYREALPLFAWIVERFPASANAYDSLGEAQFVVGDRVKALASFKKAAQLDPKGHVGIAAAGMVKRLGEP
jgi:enterochelin esterase family protein